MQGEAFTNEDLRAFDMMGSEARIGSAAGQRCEIAFLVDYKGAVAVTTADAARVANVMDQGRQREMDPVVRLDVVLEPAAAQNILADKRHEGHVLGVMVKRVTTTQQFEDELCALADHVPIVGLAPAEGVEVEVREMIPEGLSENRGRIQHWKSPVRGCLPFG
jgi:hypothetical protein